MDAESPPSLPPPHRRIFCNRTLNLRAVRAIGYDMDYTLVHYRTEAWEARVYDYARDRLQAGGWPVAGLSFRHDLMVRGLILDVQLGNILKVNSFGYVKQAFHGTRPLAFDAQRQLYARQMVSLAEPRYVFLNTLFSLSEACLYAQLVDALDAQQLPGMLGYEQIYRRVRDSIDEAHVEGQLKAEIMADPERFVALDPEVPLALLDQRHAGKKLLLITNSEWQYTRSMMAYVFDRFLPAGTGWRDLFDLVIVAARKPAFFTQRGPLLEVVDDAGLLRPHAGPLAQGRAYWGGDASAIEESLGLRGDAILYVGDHIYGDVNVSKTLLRWRTALILRELEGDLAAQHAFAPEQEQLTALMQQKEQLELEISTLRLRLQRRRGNYGPVEAGDEAGLHHAVGQRRARVLQLDEALRPMAEAAARLGNATWGPLMRAGNDKSHLARQVERHADIYTSRVANFLAHTPFGYLRALRGSLPHDPAASLEPGLSGGRAGGEHDA